MLVDTIQNPVTITATLTPANLTAGGAKVVAKIPQGSTILDLDLVVDTAFNSGTADLFSVGDDSSVNRYTNNQNAQSTGAKTISNAALFETTDSERTLNVIWTQSGAIATAGSARLIVSYVVDGRAHENQG